MIEAANGQLTETQYREAAESLHALAGMLLFEFARRSQGVRNEIAQNFVARADTIVGGVFRLWQIEDYGGCWMLHRALLDRLFHLHVLNEENEFEVFEDWSFKVKYEAANRVRSDPEMKDRLESVVEEPSAAQKARYKNLVKNPPKWGRPKAENVARDMGVSFLYRYGYDFASAHVHPMADDGQQDFYRVVLNNTVLVASMTFQEALNASTLSWRSVVYDSLTGILNFLGSGAPEHLNPIVKVARMFESKIPLAQQGSGKDGQSAGNPTV